MEPTTPFNRIGVTRYGQLIYNVNDRYIGRSIEEYGEYSEKEAVVFDQVLQPGNVVIEAGANIGAHTLFLSRKVGPEGCVLTFEPQRLVFQTLCGNVAINSLTNVYCWNMALGAETGEIVVPVLDPNHEENFGGLELQKEGEGERVPMVTIDSFELPKCDMMKIDVEGMEEEVLLGAKDTIARLKPILYLECDRKEKEQSLLKLIHSLGYRMFWHTPTLFNEKNYAGKSENIFGETVSQNIFCIDVSMDHELTGFTEIEMPQAA